MKKGLMILVGLIVVAAIGAVSIVGSRNQFVAAEEQINAAWSQVENVLQRRNDLIPNLVNTVKGYATHEKQIFEDVAKARAALSGARTLGEKVEANNQMGSVLARLLAIAENYPNLKANEN